MSGGLANNSFLVVDKKVHHMFLNFKNNLKIASKCFLGNADLHALFCNLHYTHHSSIGSAKDAKNSAVFLSTDERRHPVVLP